MHAFIADKLPGWFVAKSKEAGIETTVKTGLKGPELATALHESQAEVLIVRSTKVTKEVIDAAGDLSLIIRAGSGVDTIDTARAAERGIYVANCPGTNAAAVAELAIALLLAVDRRIVEGACDLRNGKWAKKEYSKAEGVKDKTLGVIGVGAIGQKVIRRAQGLEMKVVAWSRSLCPDKAAALNVECCKSPLEVVQKADVVSLHLASTAETKGLVNAAFIAAMKPRAILLNTARGDLVDQTALIEALKAGKIRAGLDVFAGEPGAADEKFEHPLREVPNWVGSHHIGASTDQAQDETAMEALRILTCFARTGQVPNCVNMAQPAAADRSRLVVRHLDKVGVLAGVLDRLRDEGINIEEMENRIFQGSRAAVCYMTLSQPPTSATLKALSANPDIIKAKVVG